MKRIYIVSAIILIAIMTACQNEKKVVINGQFYGVPNRTIILEELGPYGSKIADSVRSNDAGEFKFEIDFTDKASPVFYNVRHGSQFASLLVDKGENIELSSLGNISIHYEVKGSKGSEKVQQFNAMSIEISKKLDSLDRLYAKTFSAERQAILGNEYAQQYIELKRKAIEFIIRNSSSLAAIVPLYRPIYSGDMLFDPATNDIIYYQVVADSLEKYYPTSSYVASLRKIIESADIQTSMDSVISNRVIAEVEFPDLKMEDVTGRAHSLTDYAGKTVLLSFTSYGDTGLKAMNRELLETYEEFKDAGLIIYQVDINNNKAEWIESVITGKLPWVQVSDSKGNISPSLTLYNVQGLPSYFLISSDGKLVGANLLHSQLKTEIGKIIK